MVRDIYRASYSNSQYNYLISKLTILHEDLLFFMALTLSFENRKRAEEISMH